MPYCCLVVLRDFDIQTYLLDPEEKLNCWIGLLYLLLHSLSPSGLLPLSCNHTSKLHSIVFGLPHLTMWILETSNHYSPHFMGIFFFSSWFYCSSSIKGCLPSKVVFHQRSSSIKGRFPSKVVFHRRSSSIKGCLPSKVVFHWRSSSIPELPPRYPRSESSNMSLVV